MTNPQFEQGLGAAIANRPVPGSTVAMTLIVAAGKPDPRFRGRVEAFERATRSHSTEIVVACETPWSDAPPGVRGVFSGPVSRGDKLDRACEGANGELLAFVDSDVILRTGWQERAIQLMKDPYVGAIGGPELLASDISDRQRAAFTLLSSRLGSGPLSRRYRSGPTKWVKQIRPTNLVVRKRAFVAVGGFQCPSPLGEDERLCYKLRELAGMGVLFDSGLAIERATPPLFKAFTSYIYQWGRGRGDLTRRLAETSYWIPYGLPAAAVLLGLVAAAMTPFNVIPRIALVVVALAYALAGAWLLLCSGNLRLGLLAAVGLPMFHLAYAAGFWRGYLGRSLGEIAPRRFHDKPLRILIVERRDITHPLAGGAHAYMHE